MYDHVIWPPPFDPKTSAIYALNDIDVNAQPEVVWRYFPPPPHRGPQPFLNAGEPACQQRCEEFNQSEVNECYGTYPGTLTSCLCDAKEDLAWCKKTCVANTLDIPTTCPSP
jgi:hypothetical protein